MIKHIEMVDQFNSKSVHKILKNWRSIAIHSGKLIRRYFMTLGHILIGSLGVLLILALRPIMSIKLANTFSGRLGHFAVNTELALLEFSSHKVGNRKCLIIWIQWREVSNSFLAQKWRERITTIPFPFLVSTWFMINKLGLNGLIFSSSASDRDVKDLLPKYPPILSFTESEINQSQVLLAKMGLPLHSKWVCIHNRDSAYLRTEYPLVDYSHHDYRDSDIEDYTSAMLALVELGYFVVRMGKVVDKKIAIRHPMIIDYANSQFRDDSLDVYLAANCSFFVSSGSGIDGLANIFRRPQLYVNLALPFHPLTNKRDHIFIYKHFFDVDSKQKLNFTELLKRGGSDIATTKGFSDAGIGMRPNSPLEIRNAVIEMNNLITNSVNFNNVDLDQQRAFWRAFPRITHLHGSAPFRATIGPSFLRENLHLTQ